MDDFDDIGPCFIADDVDRHMELKCYGMTVYELQKRIIDANDRPGPYPWDLVCKIAEFEKGMSQVFTDPSFARRLPRNALIECQQKYDKYFNEEHGILGRVIKMEKLQDAKPPQPPRPKSLFESLFG